MEITNADDINKSIKFYFQSFGNQFKTWILKTYPNINENDFCNFLQKYYDDDKNLEDMQNIYIIKDISYLTEQHVKIIIAYSEIKPDPVTQTILSNINDQDSQKNLMTYLNNTFMSIRLLLKAVSSEFNIDISEIQSDSMYFYKQNTNHYFAYYVTFEKQN